MENTQHNKQTPVVSGVQLTLNRISEILEDRHSRVQTWTFDPKLAEYRDRYQAVVDDVRFPDTGDASYINSIHALALFTTDYGDLPGSKPFQTAVVEKTLSVIDPSMVDLVNQILDKEDYHPKGITPTKFDEHIDIPASPAYHAPPVNPMIIAAQMACQAKYGDNHNYPFLTAFSKHKKSGLPLTTVTAQSKKAIKLAVMKNKNYTGTSFPAKELYVSSAQIVRQFGLAYDELDLSFDYYPVVDLFDKNSSMGYIPTKFYKTGKDGLTRKIKTPKKRDAPGAAADALFRFKDAVAAYLRGETEKPPSVGPELESHKLELLHWVQTFSWGDDPPKGAEDLKYKQRLFYISSAISFGLDKTVFEGLSNRMRYFLSAIGIEVTNGGLLELTDILSGAEESPLHGVWKTIADKWRDKAGIDLWDRVYGEGDWSNYDMTLAMKLLAFVVAIVFSMFKKKVTEDPLLRFILSIAHHNNVIKVMYVYMYDLFFRVVGRFLSGKFGTSFMGTICSIQLFFTYRARLLDKYPGDELLYDILGSWMFLLFFYSDDHIIGWPRVMSRYHLYPESIDPFDDFVKFCVSEFGMRYKTGFEERYESVVGVVHFTTTPTGYIQDLDRTISSPSFLKFRIVQVYLDEQPIYGPIPMKDLLEVVSKIGYGIKSSATLEREMAKVVALAHLNTNLEGYSVLRHYYDELVAMGGVLTDETFQRFIEEGESHSYHLLAVSGIPAPDFPSLARVFEKQYEGYRAKTGFCPRNPYGAKVLAPDKYRLWDTAL